MSTPPTAIVRADRPTTCPHRERGSAVAELAVTLPFLLLLMLGAVDFGRMWTTSTRIGNAAYAGATYGAQTVQTAKHADGIRAVVMHELGVEDSSTGA